MSGDNHPAPHRARLPTWQAWLLLFGGPVAWFIQLNVGEMMTSWPCFPGPERHDETLAGYHWAYPVMIGVLVLSAVVACGIGFAAFAKLREVIGEVEGDHEELIEVGHGRTRFLALWATVFAFGSAVATLTTLAAFLLVPPCLG